jgi:hypothetical protein
MGVAMRAAIVGPDLLRTAVGLTAQTNVKIMALLKVVWVICRGHRERLNRHLGREFFPVRIHLSNATMRYAMLLAISGSGLPTDKRILDFIRRPSESLCRIANWLCCV